MDPDVETFKINDSEDGPSPRAKVARQTETVEECHYCSVFRAQGIVLSYGGMAL